MAERGVSQLVSVDREAAVKLREAVGAAQSSAQIIYPTVGKFRLRVVMACFKPRPCIYALEVCCRRLGRGFALPSSKR
jgi:hypothetical protein